MSSMGSVGYGEMKGRLTMKKSNPDLEPLDFWDFMTNDDNPTLTRLANKLLADAEFTKILADNGYVDPAGDGDTK
jgi:hypothetical protein